MLNKIFSTPSVAQDFSTFIDTTINGLPETVTDLLLQHDYHFILGKSQSEIWQTFPKIVESVGKKSPRLEQLMKEGHYEPAMGLCLYFLKPPLITFTEDHSQKRGLILTHEVGHAVDNMFSPRISDSDEFKAAYELDRKIAAGSANFIQQYAKQKSAISGSDHHQVGEESFEEMHETLGTQIDDKMGRQEIWANHFTHLIHGKPMKAYFPHNFPNTLAVVRRQLEQNRIIALTPPHSLIKPALAPQKTNG